jgi:hypothetical protein
VEEVTIAGNLRDLFAATWRRRHDIDTRGNIQCGQNAGQQHDGGRRVSVFKLMRVVFLLSMLFVIVAGAWMTERRLAPGSGRSGSPFTQSLRTRMRALRRFAQSPSTRIPSRDQRVFQRGFETLRFPLTPALRFQVAPVSAETPPPIPEQFNTCGVAWWSLKMRWWAWMRELFDDQVAPDIQMFVLYHRPERQQRVGISVGMRKGRYGIVKAYARESLHTSGNLVVVAHELLHVLGATDKYVLSTGEPIYPHGFANPDSARCSRSRTPEIMGGRIPLNAFSSIMPRLAGSAGSGG